MRIIPFISLASGLFFLFLAWKRRSRFKTEPYFHWFIFLHLAAAGFHQFEEYGFPGGFRDFFVSVFNIDSADSIIPPVTSLELFNAFILTGVFGLTGWIGTRIRWIGIALLFMNMSNGYFHLTYSITRFVYVPGVITGTLLYMPLALLAVRYAVKNNDISAGKLIIAFTAGSAASFAPFFHVMLVKTIF